jgi:hypothetical protein
MPTGKRDFSLLQTSGPVLGLTQLLIQWVPGALFRGVKRPGLEVDDSSLSLVEVKYEWGYTSPLYAS